MNGVKIYLYRKKDTKRNKENRAVEDRHSMVSLNSMSRLYSPTACIERKYGYDPIDLRPATAGGGCF